MQQYKFTKDQFETHLNRAKCLVIQEMYDKGMVSAENAQFFSDNHAVIVRNPKIFGDKWSKLCDPSKESLMLVTMAMRSPEKTEKENNLVLLPNVVEEEETPKTENPEETPGE